eukprot:2406065-Rhodomonas_salina.7
MERIEVRLHFFPRKVVWRLICILKDQRRSERGHVERKRVPLRVNWPGSDGVWVRTAQYIANTNGIAFS